MTDEQIALARRVVACKGWRWLPGMRASLSSGLVVRLGEHDEGSLWCAILAGGATCTVDVHHPWYTVAPDLTDAATVGCLLALVREAWRCPTVYVRRGTTRRVSDGVMAWEVCDLWLDAEACRALGVDRQGSVGSWGHASEAEALVAALEAAP